MGNQYISPTTATDAQKVQATELADYVIDHFKPNFTLFKVVGGYYYCFAGKEEEGFHIILDSLNYKVVPLLYKGPIQDMDAYFEKEVSNLLDEPADNRQSCD